MQDIVKRRLEGGDFSSDEDKNEIRASIDFNKFSVKELLTYVEESKLYTIEEIKQRVIQINKEKDESLKEKDKVILAKENLLEMVTITKDKIIREKEEAIQKGVEDMQRITDSLKKMMWRKIMLREPRKFENFPIKIYVVNC